MDGSVQSRRAADQAVELAQALGAEVVLAYVVSLLAALGPEPMELRQWEIAEREHARELLDELGVKYRAQGARIETSIPSGTPAEALASMALPSQVAFVAVGHRGRGAISRTLLGSVADRLVQISPKPVLVAR